MAEKLSAAQRSKIRRLTAPRELAPDEEGGELNIIPFLDIITNVLMFVLATVSVTFTATIDTAPPKLGGGGGRPPSAQSLNLTVLIVKDGISIKARGGNVAPGCSDTGAGLAVGKAANERGVQDYNFNELRTCVQKLKKLDPSFADESQVTVSASPEIPFQSVIGVIDAVRGGDKPENMLFPDVIFGVAR